MPNELANMIVSAIEPYVGKVVAQAGLKTQSAKIGKTMDTIEDEDKSKLAQLIGKAMKAFGKDGEAITNAINSV